MSKNKNTGLLIALGAVLGAAAAGISYYLKYKSYTDKIENEDFHDYEEEETEQTGADEPLSFNETNRTYITLDGGKGKSEENVSDSESADDTEPVKEEETNNDSEPSDDAETEKNPETFNTSENNTTVIAENANDAETTAKNAAPTSSAATVEEDTEGVN